MKKNLIPLFCFLLLISSSLMIVNAVTLNLTVTTSKQTYNRYEQVQISGMLTQDGSPLVDGLVAVQVVDPLGNNRVIRTVNTGQNPQTNPIAEIRAVYLSDSVGNPVSLAARGSLAHFTVNVSNYDTVPRTVLATINIYDNKNVVIDSASQNMQIQGRDTVVFTISTAIPWGAASGTGAVFANAFTNWPKNGGAAYSTEKSASFTIDSPAGNPPTTPNGNQGSFSLSYTIPQRANTGTYTVYATSAANGVTASQTTQFNVRQPGDFDADSDLDIQDTLDYVKNYLNYYAGQPWNPIADIDEDGEIDVQDSIQYVKAYLTYYSAS